MTLKELFDLFETTYKLECLKNNVQEIAINKNMEAFWISLAIQDLQREVKEFENSVTLTNVDGTYDYELPSDFGYVKDVTYNGNLLKVTSRDAIMVSPKQLPNVSSFAIYSTGLKNKIIFDGQIGAGTIVWYYTSMLLYSPSGSTTTQPFGAFDGSTASGNLVIMDYYVPAILEFMLFQLFNNRQEKYLFEVQKLKRNRVSSAPDQLTYSIGV